MRTGIDVEELEFNTRKLDLENDEDYKKLLIEYNQKMENLSKSSWFNQQWLCDFNTVKSSKLIHISLNVKVQVKWLGNLLQQIC